MLPQFYSHTQLYKRCSLASADYTELANHVLVLQTVATEVQAFARDNEIPQDEQKVASLVAARQNCMTILDELDAVLVKHTRLGSSKKRWIDVVKFVKKDVNAMKSKLAHVTALMQLALASLTRYDQTPRSRHQCSDTAWTDSELLAYEQVI